jgi:hypothetical protein
METLRSLLEAGKTPESIYEDALNIVKEMNAEKAAAENKRKKITEARTNFLKIFAEYFSTITGEPVGIDTIAAMEKDLITIEDALGYIEKVPNKRKEESGKEQETKRKSALDEFLEKIYR